MDTARLDWHIDCKSRTTMAANSTTEMQEWAVGVQSLNTYCPFLHIIAEFPAQGRNLMLYPCAENTAINSNRKV